MKLKINQANLKDFNVNSSLEWIEMNRTGCHSSSTVYGMNLRPYHGLFSVLHKNSSERSIILAKIEESVFVQNHLYDLSTNNFEAGVYPTGYQYLSEFALDPFPVFTFQIGNRRIVKTLFLVHDSNTLVIRYAVKNQGPDIKLVLKPLIAGRKTTEVARELPNMNTDSYIGENVIRLEPKSNIPEISIYFQKGDYVEAPLWYYNFKYEEEKPGEKSLNEDLFNPGFFTCYLKAYETFDLYITTERKFPEMNYESLYRREKSIRRRYRPKFQSLPAHIQFLTKQVELTQLDLNETIPYILQKYFTFKYSTRDFLWSLPGLLLVERNQTRIQHFIDICLENLKNGLFTAEYPFVVNQQESYIPQADLSLIFINIIYQYYTLRKDPVYLEKVLFEPCRNIVDSFKKGCGYGIVMDKDGLLQVGDSDKNVSGIVLKDGVNRYGKLLEFQALWYNALRIVEFFARELKKNRIAKKYAAMAELAEKSYNDIFFDKTSSQYFDMINQDKQDSSFRYHQIMQISLPFPLVKGDAALLLLNLIEDELLTPYGLRTLSRNDSAYIGSTDSILSPEDPGYYSGPVWPWTIGLYTDAVLNVRGSHRQVIAYLTDQLHNFGQITYSGTLGFISELYDGDAPYNRNGAPVYPAVLCEYLRAILTIDFIKS